MDYNFKEVEKKWKKYWKDNETFKTDVWDFSKPKYYALDMFPYPSGVGLHAGHVEGYTATDIIARFKRMQGYNTLWLPGTDHSALSTEAKIVAQMKEEGLKKSDIGRAKFLDRAWDWTKLYGGTIVSQQKMLGCSCDWSRARFTLDEGLSKAVYTAFKRLYDKGYIYKGKRMINYCTGCHTSISDAEIEYKEEATHLWHIKYQVKDSDEYLVVATTRPETMLGDTAVAVNPKDERLKHLIGKTCILPIMNKEIPIIGDRFVEMEFGTGAVKVTPAHDMNDYQAGLDHDLPVIEVFDENLVMNDLHPDFAGMNIYDARTKIVERLQEIGALIKIEDYTHNVAKCDRCHSTIEPRISDQWFVKMSELAKPAIEAVKNDDVKFIPKRYEKTFFNWMNNIKDWCISRQIWWGHQLPVYYCEDCGEIVVLDKTPDKCPKCGCTKFTRDEDTLDTWFSSALWPFSTLGWPNEDAEDFKTFYPTNTLVTGYDIIQAWVSRMIYSGLEYTGKKPFDNVFIHGIVRDSQGRKMSKSLGNGVDPLDVINEYSTDALRFSLILGITAGNDIRYMPEKLESSSNFANKLWNASKFVLMNLEDYDGIYDEKDLCKEDKWILSKLNTLVKEVTNNIDNFDIGVSTQKIYDFIWNEFCDWYIEICKTRLYDKTSTTRKAAQFTLNKVLQDSLKLLHPVMPFITEEIYTKLYNDDETIMTAEWPKFEEKYAFQKEEQEIEKLKDVIIGIRNIRNNMNVHPSRKSKLIVVTENYKDLINESESILNKLGFAESIELKNNKDGIPSNAVSVVTDGIEVFMPFEDLVDLEAEKERLQNEKTKLKSEVARATKMLSNPGFVNKAPEAKINEEKAKLAKYQEMLDSVNERLKNI